MMPQPAKPAMQWTKDPAMTWNAMPQAMASLPFGAKAGSSKPRVDMANAGQAFEDAKLNNRKSGMQWNSMPDTTSEAPMPWTQSSPATWNSMKSDNADTVAPWNTRMAEATTEMPWRKNDQVFVHFCRKVFRQMAK
jgi:hypothetical protein